MSRAVDLLAQAWRNHQAIAHPPPDLLDDTSSAYACQQALVAALAPQLGEPIGYKIGCTSREAQTLLGAEGPFYGRLLRKRSYASPARLTATQFSPRVIEPEFAFKLGSALAPQDPTTPFTLDQVAACVASVLPAIEIVASRHADWTQAGVNWLIADNGCNGAWVYGPQTRAWRDIDLAAHRMTLSVNGEPLRQGQGERVLGNPLNALHWLANALNAQGQGLAAGAYISTGVCCAIYEASAGDVLCADFAELGKVELTFDKQ